VPLLSGFFSKDEILWQTFARGHHKLWFVALVTAFLTATYMFRLVYLAFFGERHQGGSAQQLEARVALDNPSHAPHVSSDPPAGTHAHLHDAPSAMAIVLIVLAIGSVVAGYVGVPNVLVSSGNRIETFLAP